MVNTIIRLHTDLSMQSDQNPKRLFLIDAMALAYRTYFAFMQNPLTNSKGENVSVVFGFTNILLNVLDKEKPEYFGVVFDTPEPTFRHKLYNEYKAQRAEMPMDMVEQLPRIQQMLDILNIPSVSKPGFEADDVMGTLAKKAESHGIQTVLVTGDKDLMQLVSPLTVIYDPKKSGQEPEWMDISAVEARIGLPPEKIADYLALVGDSSDNIPGVPGIGPKSAVPLLQEFASVDDILNHVDNIESSRARKCLIENGHLAKLSRELTVIDCRVPLDLEPTDLVLGTPDNLKAVAFFQEMEFRSLADRFAPEGKKIAKQYNLVDSEETFSQFIERLAKVRSFAFDTETTSVDPMNAELVGLSFSWREGEAFYMPVMATESRVLDKQLVLERLRPILENKEIKKCGHNGKYDMLVLAQEGVNVQGFDFDTMVASYLLNPSGRQHNLDSLSLKFLNLKKIPTTDLIGSGRNQITMDRVPVEKIKDYACEDADVTWRLRQILAPKLVELGLQKLFEDVEMPLVGVLLIMEQNGVALDEIYLARMSEELNTELKRLEKTIYKLANGPFNINSPKQLADILFEKLKLPPSRRTKTGYSTDVSVLEDLSRSHELPRRILEYRQLAKLESTYVDALPKLVNPRTGRVHTSFNQTVAATGRLSSSNPNLQNIPIRTEIGRRIRGAFLSSSSDHVLLDADYSQIELRIMAHLSRDDTLRNSFLNGEDVHTRTAALVFNVDAADVTKDQRRQAKVVNFGIMYGMGAYGLAQRLGIPADEADAFIKTYFASYPGVQEYMIDIVRQAREKGYVTTLLNRRRYLPEISSDNRRMRDFAERTAINTPIQGSAADMIKVAMIEIQHRLQKEGYNSKMILQVHDELVFDVPKNELAEMKELVRTAMEDAIELIVPIRVDIGVGVDWLQAH